MTEVRLLQDPRAERWPETRVVPRGATMQAAETRNTLGQFLDATMTRPVWFDDAQRERQIADTLSTMTLTERVFIEVEMQTRHAPVHSFDYDPIK